MTLVPRALGDRVWVDILVQSRAARPGVGGVHAGRLRVRVAAPPVEGSANAEVVQRVAEALRVNRSAVTIVSGLTGRQKTLEILGTPGEVLAQLSQLAR